MLGAFAGIVHPSLLTIWGIGSDIFGVQGLLRGARHPKAFPA